MKAFLLIYKGSNASTIINGVKFNHIKTSEVVTEEKIKDFVHPVTGQSLYADIKIHEIFEEGGYKEINSINDVVQTEETLIEDPKQEENSNPPEDPKQEENKKEDKAIVVYTANDLKKLIAEIDPKLELKGKGKAELQELYEELTK